MLTKHDIVCFIKTVTRFIIGVESSPIKFSGIKSIGEVKHTCSSLADSLPGYAGNLLIESKAGALPAFISQNILEGHEFSKPALSTERAFLQG